MDTNDKKIIAALEYIKSNPMCSTDPVKLNGVVVEHLHKLGVISAVKAPLINTKVLVYNDIRLNFAGEQYLASLKEPKPDVEKPAPKWHSNPFLLVSLGIVGTLIAQYLISYFDL